MGGSRVSPLFLLLLFSSSFRPFLTSAAGQVTQKTPTSGIANWQKTWCVAKPSANDTTLLANVNYACSQVDCGVLRKGCPCFYPDNLMSHASIAMNMYYQAKGRNKWNCDFRSSGLIVITDPSYSDCAYTA